MLFKLFDDVKSDEYKGTSAVWLSRWPNVLNMTNFVPAPFVRWDHLLMSIFIRRYNFSMRIDG
ncbi:MAG: hypothetical protein RLZZ74_1194 [Cyanobacteriota bacterium]|jgi:hypothetical protein